MQVRDSLTVLQVAQVHDMPGSNSNVLGLLADGQILPILARQDDWLKIPFRGRTGWIPKKAAYLSQAGKPTAIAQAYLQKPISPPSPTTQAPSPVTKVQEMAFGTIGISSVGLGLLLAGTIVLTRWRARRKRRILGDQPKPGKVELQGQLAPGQLADILSLLSQNRRSVLIHVDSQGPKGLILLTGGKVTCSQTQNHQGKDAVFELLELTEGSFAVLPQQGQAPRQCRYEVLNLLMEFAAKQDHETRSLRLMTLARQA